MQTHLKVRPTLDHFLKSSAVLRGIPILAAAIYLFSWPNNGVTVLAYHKVSNAPSIYSIDPDLFERQMSYLAGNGYSSISLPYLAEALAGKTPLPDKSIIITFDDGYEDNYLTALPIMEKYGMRAAVFIAVDKVSQPGYMSWDQINAMQAKGVDIGSHSMSHPALTDISPSEQTKEILASKKALEKHLNRPVNFIAYPYGKFNPEMFNLLRQVGYRGAFSGISGLNFPGDNPYTLKRISILSPKFDIWSFQFRLIRTMISSKLGL